MLCHGREVWIDTSHRDKLTIIPSPIYSPWQGKDEQTQGNPWQVVGLLVVIIKYTNTIKMDIN